MGVDDQGVGQAEFDQMRRRVAAHAVVLKKQAERTKVLRKLLRKPHPEIFQTAKDLGDARDEIRSQEQSIKTAFPHISPALSLNFP